MRRRLSITFTIIIIGLVIGYILNRPKYKTDMDDFGKSYNKVRSQIGVPPIEDSWVAHKSDSAGATWMNASHGLLTKDAHHFAKRVRMDNGRLTYEEDSYNKFLNDSVDNRVVYLYNFDTKEWTCKLSIHYYRAYPPDDVRELNLKQADSIINSRGSSTKLNAARNYMYVPCPPALLCRPRALKPWRKRSRESYASIAVHSLELVV